MEFSEAWDDTCSSVGLAARHGDINELQRLIQNGSSINAADNRGWRPIHEAAFVPENIACLEELLRQEDSDVNCRTHEGETALLLACKRKHGNKADVAVEVLLRYGADPNIIDNEEETPLLVAAKSGNLQVINRLLLGNSDPDIGDCSGWRPLHQAAMQGHVEMLKILLVAGANINVQDECGMTPIFTASQHGQDECLQELLRVAIERGQAGAINIGAEDWATPLMIAAQQGFVNCVKILLDHGANPNLRTADNITALHVAVQGDKANCLRLLLEMMELEPLIRACHPVFVSSCPRPTAEQKEFVSPLHLAVEWQSYECLQLLLSVGFSPDSVHQRTSHPVDFFLPADQARHESALSYAVYKEDKEAIAILLKGGATCNTLTPYALHPVVRALSKPSPEMLNILLEHGSDLNHCRSTTNTNEIFLAAIVTQYHLEQVLQCGCDPQACFRDGSAQLFAAAVVMNSNKRALTRILQLILQFVVINGAVQKAYFMVESKAKQFISRSDIRWREVLKQLAEPSSLSHICRIKIRHHMYSIHGPHFINFVPGLSLPSTVENYLLFKSLQRYFS